MRPELVAIAIRNGGLFRREHAFANGYSSSEIRGLTRKGGAWVIVRRGVYVERAVWERESADGRYRLEVRAALLNLEHEAYASHGSAAALLGLPMLTRWRDAVHITRPGAGGGRSEHGVRHHPARVPKDQLTTCGPLVITGLVRTGLDIAREHGFEDGVCACDAARRLGATLEQFRAALLLMRNWPGVTKARAAVDASDPGAENIYESLARVLVLELGLGRPRTQVPITDGRRTAYVDMLLGRHVFEFDGKVKYIGRERGGVASKPVDEVLWDEKKREDWLRRQSLGVSRIIAPDLYGDERKRARSRLARECLETFQRFPGEYP